MSIAILQARPANHGNPVDISGRVVEAARGERLLGRPEFNRRLAVPSATDDGWLIEGDLDPPHPDVGAAAVLASEVAVRVPGQIDGAILRDRDRSGSNLHAQFFRLRTLTPAAIGLGTPSRYLTGKAFSRTTAFAQDRWRS